jgi:hypothetical protein
MYALQLGREFNELKNNINILQKNILRIQIVFIKAFWQLLKNIFGFFLERPKMIRVHGQGVHEVVEHRYIETNF